jgi:hypothetical protein
MKRGKKKKGNTMVLHRYHYSICNLIILNDSESRLKRELFLSFIMIERIPSGFKLGWELPSVIGMEP